ncbi:DUF934 domain-containing protein [Pistricoccus aurantiacus]|uniref:DUF934 domain-containing protein n=1 Tax=Pistricoccus aurantiacus TaxID=1883414 RepID=UPI0036310887
MSLHEATQVNEQQSLIATNSGHGPWHVVETYQAAPWLASDTVLDPAIYESLADQPVIAIDFPAFTDGRGYTLARQLRERYGYRGEIRAVGDVLIDQLFYMHRCGFDAFLLREDQVVEDALNAQHTFSLSYQISIDTPEPLFLRRLREAASQKALLQERKEDDYSVPELKYAVA